MKIRTFKTKKSKKFFFSFLSDKGTTLLKSIPFDQKAERDEAKRAVLDDFSNQKGIERHHEAGKHFMKVNLKNNTILNSEAYKDASARDKDITSIYNASKKLIAKEAEMNDQIEQPVQAYQTDGRSDDYKKLGFYEAQHGPKAQGINAFYDEASKEHYFSYVVNGQSVLISEGYNSADGQKSGINSVESNLNVPERYDRQQHKNGKFFFNLKAANNQKIATSRWFDSEKDLNKAISTLTQAKVATRAVPTTNEKVKPDQKNQNVHSQPVPSAKDATAFAKAETNTNSDVSYNGPVKKEYLSTAFYGGQTGFNKFEVRGFHYFSLVDQKGEVILMSQAYSNKSDRNGGIESVKESAVKQDRWQSMDEDGKQHFVLRSNKNQILCKTCSQQKSKDLKQLKKWVDSVL